MAVPDPSRRRCRPVMLLLAAALVVGAAGCGDDAESEAATTGPCAESEVIDNGPDQAPTVEPLVGGQVPDELVVEDVTEGTGAEAMVGNSITVHYIGIACSTGKVFDSSWERDMPLEAQLDPSGLIDGWIQGIPGMKEGGRRVLVIPPSLAYGPSGQGTDIGPNETLFFVIDLIETGAAAPAGGAPTPGEPTVPSPSDVPATGGAPTSPAPPG